MTARRSASTLAPAKINLFLRVLHRRPDGYRELETLFQAVSLYDRVRVHLEPAGTSSIRLEVVGADLGPNRDNLAWRAAQSFLSSFAMSARVEIELEKHIPAGAGLGGGSSDAAAVLRCMAALTGVSDDNALHRVGTRLGSDVPFFLGAPLAIGRGRGEELTEVSALPRRPVVLALPPVHQPTVEAFRMLPEEDVHGGTRVVPLREDLNWDQVDEWSENDFEAAVVDLHTEVQDSLDALVDAGADVAGLSGSGSACFGCFDSDEVASAVATTLSARLGWRFVAVSTESSLPTITES
ncbi:MAG: 4-(cytidine 5'-diphospho)-2-C-methyl-D-erythritol kinase [Longimicrobiales bacterium]|nr:4-(cytidine 5'-diphospho)-2-C-methyl-D-erythritol kinase [Longimicrobiales bacterium]